MPTQEFAPNTDKTDQHKWNVQVIYNPEANNHQLEIDDVNQIIIVFLPEGGSNFFEDQAWINFGASRAELVNRYGPFFATARMDHNLPDNDLVKQVEDIIKGILDFWTIINIRSLSEQFIKFSVAKLETLGETVFAYAGTKTGVRVTEIIMPYAICSAAAALSGFSSSLNDAFKKIEGKMSLIIDPSIIQKAKNLSQILQNESLPKDDAVSRFGLLANRLAMEAGLPNTPIIREENGIHFWTVKNEPIHPRGG